MSTTKRIYHLLCQCFLLLLLALPSFANGLLNEVTVDNLRLNPALRSPASVISWELVEPARVSVSIMDLKGNGVRTLLDREQLQAGINMIEWDGKDDDGFECLTGVYIPIIKVKSRRKGTTNYNPTAKPWGTVVDIEDFTCDLKAKEATFSVTSSIYGRIRIGGGEGGPVYFTPSIWKVYRAGSHSVTWENTDVDHLQNVTDSKVICGFETLSLPENSIYLIGREQRRDEAEKEYLSFPVYPPHGGHISYNALNPDSLGPEPKLAVDWQTTKRYRNMPEFKNNASFTVSFDDPNHGGSYLSGPSELMIFIDDVFIVELTVTKLPAVLTFDSTKFTNGSHRAVINLMTANKRSGTLSTNIHINN
jgi:hypothetical protein